LQFLPGTDVCQSWTVSVHVKEVVVGQQYDA